MPVADWMAGLFGPRGRIALAGAALALLLAGCSGSGGGTDVGPMGAGNADGQGWFGSQMRTTTVANSATPAPGTPGAFDPNEYTCPKVEIRGGAAAWQITDKGDGALRYQATLGQTARECKFAKPDMTVRIGIQGRVLIGAKGGPGSLTVPVRVAVVQEGPSPQPIWTKLYSVPVSIGPAEMQVDFSLVVEDATFPLPAPATLERYVIYIGFDPQAGAVAEARGAKPKPAAAAKPAAPKPTPVATKPKPAAPKPTPPAASSAPTPTVTQSPPPAAPAPAQQPAPPPAAAIPAPAEGWIGAPAPAPGTFTPTQ